ncbi:carboxypeptidase C (cathepsin A) [Sphingomonas sp. SORGH_AS802]|uniref:S10 family peptidase n=1 Tax=unclassified Sphingomonas TaxID=196159 RepID=UPI002854FFB7|nr:MULTISPECIES: peptidase S10 [unclassified Sphingomonas]MDR6126453.1 carboxypeptidase C (cathepsin A) [Sphingomonas sp. SORGH_AS_0438]MDR6136283.1 carboxypeptidase C (cathepsin A) [Sphingomonas sp. SORGH_AS_0802]
MRSFRHAASILTLALLATPAPAPAAAASKTDDKTAPADKKDGDETKLPPLPADKSITQSVRIGGRTISYRATVGTLPVRDEKGETIGQVVYTAYTVPGSDVRRPVTFAFNGGPGAASVYLNMGAVGPKHVQFGAQGDAPSDAPIATDNPNSWLDFTDLVFIDPIGTGFSRSLVDEEKTKKAFYANDPDIKYLSKIVYDWLVQSGRLRSPKYVMGESYGGYRAPRIAYELQSQIGVGVNGLILVSPYLDPAVGSGSTALSPLPWMIDLPSMAAANLERQGKLTPQAMAEVEAYTRGPFATDLLLGRSNPEALNRLVERVTQLTGLDPALVRRMGGRIDTGTYLREIHRAQGTIGSVYDSNVTAFDPFPWAKEQQSNDPILDSLIAPTTSAMVDFVTREVGWKTDARYHALSYAVNQAWDRGKPDDTPVTDLRKAIANDPKMKVMIVHGWDDLSCPFFASRLIVDQMPAFGQTDRVKLDIYPGGHMFYSRTDSGAAFKRDAEALYRG